MRRAALLVVLLFALPVLAEPPQVKLDRDDEAGTLRVAIGDDEALVYQYHSSVDLPHYWPVRSPSGKSMTVQHPDPYPHHRSFWFGDKVRLTGQRDVNFYACWYTRTDTNDPQSPLNDHVRHVEFLPVQQANGQTTIAAKLVWEMDRDRPVLDELRRMRIVPLGQGEYLLDMTFELTAAQGDVEFVSDWVHYAWPYVRMNKTYSVEGGGTITSSAGGVNQAQTNGKEALWVDCSNTVEGQAEGLALLSHPQNPQPHKWLTRDYGCFGPRRPDAQSGKRFTLEQGEKIVQRVGVLVHRGDVKTGQVAERYQRYAGGQL